MIGVKTHTKTAFKSCLLALLMGPLCLSANTGEDTKIPFQLINDLIVLEAEVDGTSGAFLLDTGADAVVIDGVPGSHHNEGQTQLSTIEGDVLMGLKKLNHLKVGSFEQYSVEAQITSLSDIEQFLGIDLYGIIGGSFFMSASLVMDFTTSTIIISHGSPSPYLDESLKAVPFKVRNQIPVVPVKIGNKTYDFALDSGASAHFVDNRLLKKKDIFAAINGQSNVLSVGRKSSAVQKYSWAQFSLNDLVFTRHQCLAKNFNAVNQNLDRPIYGILSLSLLAKEKIIIDFKQNRLYL